MNYTVTEDYTRITEFKWLTEQTGDKTTIMREYSRAYEDPATQIPYYAIINDDNDALYARYRRLTDALPNFHPLGRLAEYRYFNMDKVVADALAGIREDPDGDGRRLGRRARWNTRAPRPRRRRRF